MATEKFECVPSSATIPMKKKVAEDAGTEVVVSVVLKEQQTRTKKREKQEQEDANDEKKEANGQLSVVC